MGCRGGLNRAGTDGGFQSPKDGGHDRTEEDPDELPERVQRLVRDARDQEPDLSLTAGVKRIGPRVGINVDTLRGWCKQADIDAGRTPGTTLSESAKVKELEREVKELKRASENVLATSSFLARELDPRLPW